MDLNAVLRRVPDFPKPGINFIDITTVLNNPQAFQESINQMRDYYRDVDLDVVVGIESRGFIFASILAFERKISFVPVRKPGKLPADTLKQSFDLEYGSDTLEIHNDAIKKGQKVLIIDDLLATGGTVQAAIKLVERLGGVVVGCWFLVELDFLKGRDKLNGYPIHSVVHVDHE